jgi:putative addiction module component (TIGR02574 family)
MSNKNEILAEAMNLPPVVRAQLIEELISSFDSAERERLDKLWGAECESRITAYEEGNLSATPLESVLEKINSSQNTSGNEQNLAAAIHHRFKALDLESLPIPSRQASRNPPEFGE